VNWTHTAKQSQVQSCPHFILILLWSYTTPATVYPTKTAY